MSTPVTPLPPAEALQVMKDATRHGYLWDVVRMVDNDFNKVTGGDLNMTFSTRMALWSTEFPKGSVHERIGSFVCSALNEISPDHGAKAELADLARAEQTAATLEAAPTVEQEGQ